MGLGDLQAEPAPFDRVVVADPALFLEAQDLAGRTAAVGDEGASRLLWHHRETGVVGRQVALGDPPVGCLERGDPGQGQFLGQAVLEGSQGALGTAPRLGRVGRYVADAELGQGPSDLRAHRLGNRLPRLGGVKIMAAPVGVELAKQPVPLDHFGDAAKDRLGAFLLDQEGRVDRTRRLVEGDHQIVLPIIARQPGKARGVLVQHHAHQRPARPLLAMRRTPRRRLRQPGPVQRQPRAKEASPAVTV